MWNDSKTQLPREIDLQTFGTTKVHYFCPHLVKTFRIYLPIVYKDLAQCLALDLTYFLYKGITVCFLSGNANFCKLTMCVCACCPRILSCAAQRSMLLNKHSMAAGAHSQGWGQEEGMRLGGNKSKFLWNDLTGNDRVSALYNHTERERGWEKFFLNTEQCQISVGEDDEIIKHFPCVFFISPVLFFFQVLWKQNRSPCFSQDCNGLLPWE